jgi:hypothetical protein
MSPTDLAIETNHPHAHGVTGYHHIDESVAVYLHAAPDGTGWVICDTATDGYALARLRHNALITRRRRHVP